MGSDREQDTGVDDAAAPGAAEQARAVILARRKQFMAAALASLSVGAGACEQQPTIETRICLSLAPVPGPVQNWPPVTQQPPPQAEPTAPPAQGERDAGLFDDDAGLDDDDAGLG